MFLQKKIKMRTFHYQRPKQLIKICPMLNSTLLLIMKGYSVEVVYGGGKTSLAEYNKESGEILFDGKISSTS